MENFIFCAVRATFWEKLIFQKSNIPHYPLFLESHLLERLLLQKTLYSLAAALSQHTLSEDLLIHSKTSFLQLQFLFVSQ